MTPALASALTPLLRLLDAEHAHELALMALRHGLVGTAAADVDDPRLATRALGLSFRNPIGLAAGFDKNATAIVPLARLGFGFLEAGTVTPQPQFGNPRPRLFRLTADRAVINAMGFNNDGLKAFQPRLASAHSRLPAGVVLGANLGINKDGADAERDYPALVAAVAQDADYVVINVSSPNTPGLRTLQQGTRLSAILRAVREAVPNRPPLLVKIAPDLSAGALEAVVASCIDGGAEGMIVGNTTVSRPEGLRSRQSGQAGGLSGAPLFALSTAVLRQVARLARRRLLLVASGGVESGADALTKIRAGATLVQIYTTLVFQGPAVVARICRELGQALADAKFASVADAVGTDLG
jgi:dihydroorotate dehydrogenase